MDGKPKKRVSWRNVFLLCCIQLPFWYYACGYIVTPPGVAPKLNSPEGRSLFREVLSAYLPEVAKGIGVQR